MVKSLISLEILLYSTVAAIVQGLASYLIRRRGPTRLVPVKVRGQQSVHSVIISLTSHTLAGITHLHTIDSLREERWKISTTLTKITGAS